MRGREPLRAVARPAGVGVGNLHYCSVTQQGAAWRGRFPTAISAPPKTLSGRLRRAPIARFTRPSWLQARATRTHLLPAGRTG
jgi:hypothetical protein